MGKIIKQIIEAPKEMLAIFEPVDEKKGKKLFSQKLDFICIVHDESDGNTYVEGFNGYLEGITSVENANNFYGYASNKDEFDIIQADYVIDYQDLSISNNQQEER